MKTLKRIACFCGRQIVEVLGAIKMALIIGVCGVIFCGAIVTFVNYAAVILARWRF